jgi:hypothetical protein
MRLRIRTLLLTALVIAMFSGALLAQYFETRGSFSVSGYSPQPTVVGDFNHDNRLDIAVVTDSGVSVLLGNGDGTFQSPATYRVGNPRWIGVADFNGDKNLDLVVADFENKQVGILLGNLRLQRFRSQRPLARHTNPRRR